MQGFTYSWKSFNQIYPAHIYDKFNHQPTNYFNIRFIYSDFIKYQLSILTSRINKNIIHHIFFLENKKKRSRMNQEMFNRILVINFHFRKRTERIKGI